jgi:NADH-quinone oxidoreductase subunit J
MSWVFAVLALLSAAFATLSQNLKYSILCLWITGLGIGAIFLTINAEFLGIIQWIISTLVAISFIFFAVMFGDFGSNERRQRRPIYLSVWSLLIGMGFSAVIWLATSGLPVRETTEKFTEIDIKKIGMGLVNTHFLALEVLTMSLFIVLIGCGSITKIEKGNSK